MSRRLFDTGEKQRHQGRVAKWVRRRMAGQNGRTFEFPVRQRRHKVQQFGVILADGVGLGKTWEALAATSLLLVESSKKTKAGQKKKKLTKHPAKVLVLCPPGLVSKWMREILDPKGFGYHLTKWVQKSSAKRRFVKETFRHAYAIRRASDLDGLPQGTRKWGKLYLPDGIYVCNWNVLGRKPGSGNSRQAALPRQPWQIVIADEAHHHQDVKKALHEIGCHRHQEDLMIMLLSATPFQLSPPELHHLLEHLVDHRVHRTAHQVIGRPPVRPFVTHLEAFFQGNGNAKDAKVYRQEAQLHLRQIVVRNQIRSSKRHYYLIDAQGQPYRLKAAPDSLSERDLGDLHAHLIVPDRGFEKWYFRHRLHLAYRQDRKRTYVATKLRQMLSTRLQARKSIQNKGNRPPNGTAPSHAPRVQALEAWAFRQAKGDLLRFIAGGKPRKILVFTSFVVKAKDELCKSMRQAIRRAFREVRTTPEWQKMSRQAPANIGDLVKAVQERLKEDDTRRMLSGLRRVERDLDAMLRFLQGLAKRKQGDFQRDLFGQKHFSLLVKDDLCRRLGVILEVARTPESEEEVLSNEWQRKRRSHEISRFSATLEKLRTLDIVATYTGSDDRKVREASGEAFRSPLGPWALVASNVGSEGIDLQTFTAHLVHFDIEWNPARMEQREGRADRVGRLHSDVNIYFLLVQKTYDERMLHQLVARQRWHGVLLGHKALYEKEDDGEDVPREVGGDIRKLTLDLRPPK